MKQTRSLGLFFIAGILAAIATNASAQVAIYKIDFKRTGRGLNFDFYDGAYFITQAPQGAGTFVFLVSDGVNRYYTIASNSGQMFLTKDGDILMASIAGSSGGGGATGGAQSILLMNSFDVNPRGIGAGITVPLGDNLKGYFTAYRSTVSSGNGTGNGTISIIEDKFAGFAEANGKLERGMSREVNSSLGTISDGTDLVIKKVKREGYKPEPVPSGGGAVINVLNGSSTFE